VLFAELGFVNVPVAPRLGDQGSDVPGALAAGEAVRIQMAVQV
jgi:hypothetical protein